MLKEMKIIQNLYPNKGSDYNRGLDYAFNQMEDYLSF